MASTKESHLNEVRALHKRIGAMASDLNAAQAEVQRLWSAQRPPLDLPLLMGILRAVHSHPDLPREPILHVLTGALPRGKYQLPSFVSPLFLWSLPLIVAIVSLSEPGDIDWKPLVRSLRLAKTVSFELLEVHPLHPGNLRLTQLRPPLPPFTVRRRQPRLLAHPHPSFLPPLPPPPPQPEALPWHDFYNGSTTFHHHRKARRPTDFTFFSTCPADAPALPWRFPVHAVGISFKTH